MTKRELIDGIMEINHTAEPDFLAQFADDELDDYLAHLRDVQPGCSAGLSHGEYPAAEPAMFHNACNTAIAEFPAHLSIQNSTNPFGNITATAADIQPSRVPGKTSPWRTGFSQPADLLAAPRPNQPENDDQTWLF